MTVEQNETVETPELISVANALTLVEGTALGRLPSLLEKLNRSVLARIDASQSIFDLPQSDQSFQPDYLKISDQIDAIYQKVDDKLGFLVELIVRYYRYFLRPQENDKIEKSEILRNIRIKDDEAKSRTIKEQIYLLYFKRYLENEHALDEALYKYNAQLPGLTLALLAVRETTFSEFADTQDPETV